MNERIMQIRKDKNLSQAEFAERLGFAQKTISTIETGERNVNSRHIALICMIFNIREEWLRNGIGDMYCKVHPLDEVEILNQKISALDPKDREYVERQIDLLLKMKNVN